MRTSRKLDPVARKAAQAGGDTLTEVMVQVNANANFRNLIRELLAIGASLSIPETEIEKTSNVTGFIPIQIPAGKMNALAEIEDVISVSGGTRLFSP
jgi:hypothetical protein